MLILREIFLWYIKNSSKKISGILLKKVIEILLKKKLSKFKQINKLKKHVIEIGKNYKNFWHFFKYFLFKKVLSKVY